MARMRVEHRKLHRPRRLGEIADVRHHRIGHARADRQAGRNRAALLLRVESDHARNHAQRQKRQLLQNQPENSLEFKVLPLPAGCNTRHSTLAARHSSERPIIQQQQDERQGHQHRLAHQPQPEAEQSQTVVERGTSNAERGVLRDFGFPPLPSALDPRHIAGVGPECKEEEKSAQHILPLRHPRHRLHVQWVQREERGHQPAAPNRPGHAPQHHEQQQRVRGMEHHAHQVMCPGALAKKLTVQGVREPCQRMPVAGMAGSEGPAHRLPAQTVLDVLVRGDIIRVVVIDKIELPRGPIHCQCRQQKKQAAESHDQTARQTRSLSAGA